MDRHHESPTSPQLDHVLSFAGQRKYLEAISTWRREADNLFWKVTRIVNPLFVYHLIHTTIPTLADLTWMRTVGYQIVPCLALSASNVHPLGSRSQHASPSTCVAPSASITLSFTGVRLLITPAAQQFVEA
jgi:hypothetical protein